MTNLADMKRQQKALDEQIREEETKRLETTFRSLLRLLADNDKISVTDIFQQALYALRTKKDPSHSTKEFLGILIGVTNSEPGAPVIMVEEGLDLD